MDCKEIKENMISCSGQTEGSEECASIREHLAVCPNCRQEWEAYAGIFVEIGEAMEDSAAVASPSPNAWAGIKTQLTEKRSRIPTFASIKSKVVRWGRKFWSRPVWQRVVSVASVAAIVTMLVITQLTVGLSPAVVIARAQEAAAQVDSYHVTRITISPTTGDTIRQEEDYLAPDRRNEVTYVNDIKAGERRHIGDSQYFLNLETGEWELYVDSSNYMTVIDMGDVASVLADFSKVEVFADEVIDKVVCRHHKTSFYTNEWDASLARRFLETETDPDEIAELEKDIKRIEQATARGDMGDAMVMEYWIGKDDYLLRKVDFTIEREVDVEYAAGSGTLIFSQINQPIEIEAPSL